MEDEGSAAPALPRTFAAHSRLCPLSRTLTLSPFFAAALPAPFLSLPLTHTFSTSYCFLFQRRAPWWREDLWP